MSYLKLTSKILEEIVSREITQLIEVHKLLPDNQHGFRQKKSTMTAPAAMQMEWAENENPYSVLGPVSSIP